MKSSILLILELAIVFGSFAQDTFQNSGNIQLHSGAQLAFFGDLTNNGTITNSGGTLLAAGSNSQAFNGSSAIALDNLTIDKASNSLQLDNELQISGVLTFIDGTIVSDHADAATEFIHFLDGASHSGASDASYIDGVVRKTGNDAFDFPVGDNGFLRPISISAPANAADHFTAYYSQADPATIGTALETGLDHISPCEYWVLNRTGGSSDVEVTLSWGANCSGVENLCEIEIARWDGAEWASEGNGGTTGTTASGTLVSGSSCTTPAAVTNFSPFTLASTTSDNPLPIELLSFEVTKCGFSACISWQTSTEVNNDFFTVERSKDGISWESIDEIKGAGNSTSALNYETTDYKPYQGISYYRLKQTDFDGKFTYSKVEDLEINGIENGQTIVYPIPAIDQITIKGELIEVEKFRIFTTSGLDVTSKVKVLNNNKLSLNLDVRRLQQGVYIIRTPNSNFRIFKK